MLATKTKSNITEFIDTFSKANKGRPTRLGVLEQGRGAVIDYWLEDGLPLVGMDVDEHDIEKTTVQIMLGNRAGSGESHFTHRVNGVRLLKIEISVDGKSDGIDILDSEGTTTTMRFERE